MVAQFNAWLKKAQKAAKEEEAKAGASPGEQLPLAAGQTREEGEV